MMKSMFAALLALAFWCGPVHADPMTYARYSEDKYDFVVSGVLRKSTEGVVIKLVQSIEKARSQEEAIGQFTRKAMREYPDYSIWDTVVTPLPKKECGTAI